MYDVIFGIVIMSLFIYAMGSQIYEVLSRLPWDKPISYLLVGATIFIYWQAFKKK